MLCAQGEVGQDTKVGCTKIVRSAYYDEHGRGDGYESWHRVQGTSAWNCIKILCLKLL